MSLEPAGDVCELPATGGEKLMESLLRARIDSANVRRRDGVLIYLRTGMLADPRHFQGGQRLWTQHLRGRATGRDSEGCGSIPCAERTRR